MITVSREGAVTWLTLDRPAQRNALNDGLLAGLADALALVRDDAETRVVVLTGAPPAFSAGADMRDASSRFLRRFACVLDAVEALEQPTIAMVNGHAVGAGWALALACDFRVAAADAQFWLPEADLGIALAVPLAVRFVRVAGPAAAKAIANPGAHPPICATTTEPSAPAWICTTFPDSAGRLPIPVLSIHTIGDLFVPLSMEQIYARRADAAGRADRLVIRAIRDLPEPKITKVRMRTLVLGAVGILAGAAVGFAGYLGDDAIALCLGVPVTAFSASPLLRRLLPERSARLVIAGTVLGWGLAVYQLFPDVMAAGDMMVFVVQGVVLTAGAVSLASGIDRVWAFAIERLARGTRGLAPRLGIAYPLARRFRTSMLLGMFSLVIFTVTIMTAMSASIAGNTDATVQRVAAGFDVVLDTNPANPVAAAALTERPDVAAVAGLVRGVASFEAAHLDGARASPVTSFDEGLLARGVPGLFRHDPKYASDEAAYQAVLNDASLAIVPEDFLVAGIDDAVLTIGDAFSYVDPATGQARELTVAGVGEADWLANGALVNREVTAALFGDQQVVDRFYLAAAGTADADSLAAAVNAEFLAHGADARTFTAMGTAGMGQLLGFIALLRAFLGLGLLVGIAGLGVVMVRAVRERRHEIGMLRAMGFSTGIVRAAMLSEAGLIAVQGTVIGAVLGMITTRQLLAGSDSFGDVPPPFVLPWVGLLVILGLPLLASLAATAWPASRAAAIKPAVALRIAD